MRQLSDFGHNLRAGLRLSLFLPVHLTEYRPSFAQAIWLTLLLLAARTVLGLATSEEPYVLRDEMVYLGAFLVASILAVVVVARVAGQGEGALPLYVVLFSVVPEEAILDWLCHLVVGATETGSMTFVQVAVTLIVMAWVFAMLVRAVRLVFGVRWKVVAGLSALYVIVELAVIAVPVGLEIWHEDQVDCSELVDCASDDAAALPRDYSFAPGPVSK